MQKYHHIGNQWTTEEVKLLRSIGISVKESVFSYINVETDQCERIKDVFNVKTPGYAYGAVFDKTDMNDADWLL